MSPTCGPTTSDHPASLGATIGASFVGTLLASALYGATSMQTITFFWNYRQDARWLKIAVLFLWVLDTIHLAFIGHAVYTYVITDFGNIQAIEKPLWSITAHVLLSNLSDAVVRTVFLYRIWKIKMEGYFTLIVVVVTGVISLMVLASGCAFSVWGFLSANYIFKHRELSVFVYTNLVSSMVADLLIAASFSWNLQRQRSKNISRTTDYAHYLMVCSISIGLLISVCTLLAILLYALLPFPKNFAFVAIYFVLPQLLLNSLLVTLNIRKPLFRTGGLGTSEIYACPIAENAEMGTLRPWYSAMFECLHRRHRPANYPTIVNIDVLVEQVVQADDDKLAIAKASASLVVFVTGCTFAGWGFRDADYVLQARGTDLSIFLYMNLSASILSDLLISAFFCWFLNRRRTGLASTDYIIDYLMAYSITIGFVMSLFTLACLLLYAALPFPKRFAFVAIYFVLPKLLLNALLSTLNIRKPVSSLVPNGFSMFSVTPERNQTCMARLVAPLRCVPQAFVGNPNQRQITLNIHVDVERHVLADDIAPLATVSQKETGQDNCPESCPDSDEVFKVCHQTCDSLSLHREV
ncbi:hypothetical protein FOMPIDRAFT_1045521 [Fomitopsis schrenkii]|uniref:DUF6534 domain-containing protein n=1 Tax=Fomitopsis schrenkii TaxID=2126942 RepID=S8EPA1_FOMSC|nr:hypothetical protein FOMPIDRAFT_1045521 [Fomitopsis schrenkii]